MIQKPENLGEVLIVATRGLGVEVATAHAIAAHVVGKNRAWVIAHPEATLTTDQVHTICNMLTWVRMGRPLAQLTGNREFFGLDFAVTNDVLVPRPETEQLVEIVRDWVQVQSFEKPAIIDVGTGSGIIAVTLGHLLPQAMITAVDISERALTVASQNASKHDVGLNVIQSDLLDNVDGVFNVIAANLPYIATDILQTLPVKKFEPRLALDGGETGLSLFERFFVQAPQHITRPGLIVLEIGYDQGTQVSNLAHEAFPNADIHVHRDFAELDRVVTVEIT